MIVAASTLATVPKRKKQAWDVGCRCLKMATLDETVRPSLVFFKNPSKGGGVVFQLSWGGARIGGGGEGGQFGALSG